MKAFVSIAVLAMLLAATAFATPLTNGGFETCTGCVLVGPGYTTINTPTTLPDGWFVESGNIDWVSSGVWQPHSGTYSVDLNGTIAGDLSQANIDVVIGGQYRLYFWKSVDPTAQNTTLFATLRVQLDANNSGSDIIDPFSATRAAGQTRSNMTWTQDYVDFTATQSLIKITFDSLEFGNEGAGSPSGVLIDDISLTRRDLVPEPGTLSLILGAGLLGIGGLLRRRRA